MKKQNFTNHAFSGYDAYQQYDLCYSFNKEKAYLIWNERNNQQITNGTFNWNGIFENRPYIEKKLYPDGKAAYQMPILTNWQHETKTALKLPDYIDLSQQPAGMFDTVNKYIPTFQQQAETALQELEAFDRKAELIIKVVYYETEQAILNTGNYSENERTALVDQLHNRKNFHQLYQAGVRQLFFSCDMIISKWVPEIAASVLMPEPLKQSLNNGLNAVLTQKSELFKNYASILFGYLTLSNIQLKLSLNTWKPETEQSPLTKGATGESMFLHGEPVQKTSLENPAALTIDDLQGNYPKTVIRLGIDEDIPWEKVHSIINSAMESHGLKVTHSNFESFKQYLTNNKIRKMDKKKNEPKQ